MDTVVNRFSHTAVLKSPPLESLPFRPAAHINPPLSPGMEGSPLFAIVRISEQKTATEFQQP